MNIYDWPTAVRPGMIRWTLVSNAAAHKSPLSGAITTNTRPGTTWQATLQVQALKPGEIRVLESLLAKLNGLAHRVRVWHHGRETTQGVGHAGFTPRVSGAGQSGNSLNTNNWPLSTTGLMVAGDRIQIGEEQKVLTADVDSDGTGAATIEFMPPLRSSPADLLVLGTSYCTSVMMLASNNEGEITQTGYLSGTSITFIEDITA